MRGSRIKRAGAFIVAAAVLAPAAPAAAKPQQVSVERGANFGHRIFPDDAFTVRDDRQLTGRRVRFRRGRDFPVVDGRLRQDCDKGTYSICDAFRRLNELDGVDLQPRVTVPFTAAIDLDSVGRRNVFITSGGRRVTGLGQLTFDPRTHILAGISDEFLREGRRYRIHVTSAIEDPRGNRINACGGECVVPFTTRTASGALVRIRRSLDFRERDPNNAYARAGIKRRDLDFTQDGTADVFRAATIPPSVVGSSGGIMRTDQVKKNPDAPGALRTSVVPNLIPPGTAGFFAFGSFWSPRYQFASKSGRRDHASGQTDGVIRSVPTKRTPRPVGADRIGAIAVTPDPALFPPPWPAAVYGPGFTRSKYDIFVSADYNAARGILTIATDPAGHAYGEHSTATVTSGGRQTTFRGFGRGRDLDGDGDIGDGLDDGVGPTGHVKSEAKTLPSRKPIDGVRSGLMQTVIDNMALGRALNGLDIPGVGRNLVDPSRLRYYGISFGGIYGTMLMGTDPLFRRGLLNDPGGPIVDIARLSGFRGDLADQLERSRPALLNGGPGRNGFTEDLPLRNEAPRVIDHRGAAELQELFATSNWFERSGSPETFAPRIRLRPDKTWKNDPKQVSFQTAYGDGTVPNPTAGTLYRAGRLFDRVVYYRNDKTPTFGSGPHGWLADPRLAGRTSGQQQLAEFLATGSLINTNPLFLETPIGDANNLECLHYPDPQTGEGQERPPFPVSGECPRS
ncbi:MAG: hypothetical protein H0U42_05695 [Thermoleophilaceae bacterium]|nr:hypothetical protein [Thermoleophilaceae bacterium]